jgi:oligoribonuclease NrnB/cAMP/cGMP phosphodiesterase (DHH superfamily)
VSLQPELRFVHVVSHGPHCLDGATAAVAVARFHRNAVVDVQFSTHADIDDTLLRLRCDPPAAAHAVWITDISWTNPAAGRHLQALHDRGTAVYWIDHHRTALQRLRRGAFDLRLTHQVLDESYSAARLVFEYLQDCLRHRGETNDWFADLAHLVAMADDNDRWVHRVPGSRELALTVEAMREREAYEALLCIDAGVTYTPRMQEAAHRVRAELQRSFAAAERSRVVSRLRDTALTLVTAICDGYPSEIADAWGKTWPNAVLVFFDARSLTVSLRRSPDCAVDLSALAQRLGGGGHPAAAGCDPAGLQQDFAALLARTVAAALQGDH